MDYLVDAKDEYEKIRSISYTNLNYPYILFLVMILLFFIPLIGWILIKITFKILKANNAACNSALLFYFDPEEHERCTAHYLKDNASGKLIREISGIQDENQRVNKSIREIKRKMKEYNLAKQEHDINNYYLLLEAKHNMRELSNHIHNVKKMTRDMRDKNKELMDGYSAWITNTLDAIHETLIQEANQARNNLMKLAYTKKVDVLRKRLLQKYDSILNYFGRYNAMNEDAPINPERVLPLDERYRKEGTPTGSKPAASIPVANVKPPVSMPKPQTVGKSMSKVKKIFKRR